ncbi:hypothetical protein VHEMI10711 [[Torrubiella] hemipterigena]|uniref:SnoaL-like domain-containing protein n=1 Tax=[Torrubiella] hemipterigena TaxID=1531966 RepID=A0A0A1TDZ4_9HYPO|nr:hypothetical protein VHEMI10711 [[Torrubiella] hemipterigena]
MKLTSALPVALAASLSMPVLATPCCAQQGKARHEKVISQYLRCWGGEFDLMNSTFAPDVHLYQDRLPTANGSEASNLVNRQEFLAFIKRSRTGWEKYGFEVIFWAGDENKIAIRWRLAAIMGPDFPPKIPTNLKAGDHVTYNGTDFLQLDACSGLIKQVDSAQDLVTFFDNLGISLIPRPN